MHSLDPALHHAGAPHFFTKPWPCCGVLVWKDRREPRPMNLPLTETGLVWPSCHPRSSGVLDLHGACTWSQGEPPQQAGSPSLIWILPLAKAEGPAILYPHYLSLSCMPTSHAYLRTKACTVCTPLAWPFTSPDHSVAA